MRVPFNSIKFIVLLCVLATIAACQGQIKSENTSTQNTSDTPDDIDLKLPDKVWAIYQDHQNNYWFGSNGSGVFHYDGTKLSQFSVEDGLASYQVRGIQGDQSGNVFIETPSGVSKFDGTAFTTLTPVVSSKNEWKLTPDDLWFNCNGDLKDVYRYDGSELYQLQLPKHDLVKAFNLTPQDLRHNPYGVFGINRDREGNMWFGTLLAGAFRYDGESFLWFGEKELAILEDGRVPGVRSIVEDKDGNFWLSNFISKFRIHADDSRQAPGYEKLVGVDMSKGHFQDRLPYFNSGLRGAETDDLWMTTYGGGVWRYDGESLVNYPVRDGDREALLICIFQDNEGTLWVGSDNLGVFRFDGEEFLRFLP